MKNNILILAAFLVIIMGSCKTEDIDPGAAANNELSGEWFVEYNHEVYGHDPFAVGWTRLLTSTSASQAANELIITDEDNFWNFRVKAEMNIPSMSFGNSADTLINYIEYIDEDEEDPVPYRIKVVVQNGKIIKDAVTTAAGVVTDSIYFEVWFENLEDQTGIANDKMIVSGYRRTGFDEDEH